MLIKYLTDQVTNASRTPIFTSPKAYNFEYEDVLFKTIDNVTLSGWLIKGSTDKVIIQSHFGIQSSRSGYTPRGKGLMKVYKSDINYLDSVKHLIENGYTVLMYDLRNHGMSEQGPNPWVTGGIEEYKDIMAAVDFIATHDEYKNASIGLLSYCMSSAATTYAYGKEDGLKKYKNIKAFIAVQPITFSLFLKGFGLSQKMADRVNAYNIKRGGLDLVSSCIPYVKDIPVPTLLVQAKGDPWADFDFINDFYHNLTVEKEMYWIEGTNTRLATYDWFRHKPDKMLDFFDRYM